IFVTILFLFLLFALKPFNMNPKVDLECKVEGDPVPRVKWVLPNSVQLMPTSTSVPSQWEVAVDDSGTLHISRASFTDNGIYRCTGSSAAGADTVSVHLHVSAMPSLIQQRIDENMTFPEGSAAYIDCTATRASQPVMRWITPDGTQLTPSRLNPKENLIVFPNGTLHIQRMDFKNSGRYVCKASNGVASSSRTVMLSVRRKLLSAKATITSSSPQRTDVIYGSKLLLNCVPRLFGNKYLHPQGSLIIQNPTQRDSGVYRCTARNTAGVDSKTTFLNVF
uniref:Ig-like domain-containing protein n=1 Tax=Poecilia mexicana TaxID=48701 RepID=A0A3B3XEB8_9TELE